MPEPIIRADGNNASERYLKQLCERSFLTLWSHASVFYDKRHRGTGDGKELCDLLVVFGRHVIIFSDKAVAFSDITNEQLAWERWHRAAVLDAARQLAGAERTLRRAPDRVFIDRACKVPFPYPIPSAIDAIYHRVLVAHGAAERCRRALGGSGSLKFVPELQARNTTPFTVGDLDPTGGFVHVLDDSSLDVVMNSCDTIRDFVDYLIKKEAFVRSGRLARSSGEEHLLTCYLSECDDRGDHDFVLKHHSARIALEEGIYQNYINSPERSAKLAADQISYAWDLLIEQFATAALSGDLLMEPTRPRFFEPMLRILARESRFRRRFLAAQLLNFFTTSRPVALGADMRIIRPIDADDPHYVFVNAPRAADESVERYLNRRAKLVLQYSQVMRLTYENAHTIVGIGVDAPGVPKSPEYLYSYDGSVFPREERLAAERAQAEHGWLKGAAKTSTFKAYEYPPHDHDPRGLEVQGDASGS